MEHISTLFIQTFTTLLAIVNPLEALPIFLKLMDGILDVLEELDLVACEITPAFSGDAPESTDAGAPLTFLQAVEDLNFTFAL